MFLLAQIQAPTQLQTLFASKRASMLNVCGFFARLTVRFWKGTSTKPRGETSAAFFPLGMDTIEVCAAEMCFE